MEDLNSCSDVHSQKPKSEQNPDIKASVKRAPLHPNESLTPFRVLVIGQGAYPKNPGHPEDGRYLESDNTSHLITTRLPSHLPAYFPYNPTPIEIEIVNPTSGSGAAINTEYSFARKYVKDMWTRYGNEVDLIIHLGMADGWEWYTLEQSAWKEGTIKKVDTGFGYTDETEYYIMPDDTGKTIKDLGPCPWNDDVPKQLFTLEGLDINDLAQSTQAALNKHNFGKEIEVRTHPDPGNYLCGFVAYESLAQAFTNEYTAKVLYCHVPGWRDEESLKNGKKFVCNLISQIVAQSAASKANDLNR